MNFIKLEPGRNYAHIFFVIVGLTFLIAWIFGEKAGGIFFFLCFYYLGIIQLRSGLFFNKSWTVQYKRKHESTPITITLLFVFGTLGLIMVLLQYQ